MPLYSDRIDLSDVKTIKVLQSSPELKAQSCAKVDKQLWVYLLEVYSKCTRSKTSQWWWPHALLPLSDQNKK